MNISKNFLQKEEFNKLKNFIMGNYMPWHFIPKIVSGNEKDYQFEFCFIIDGKINCTEKMINVLDPILKKLKFLISSMYIGVEKISSCNIRYIHKLWFEQNSNYLSDHLIQYTY